MKLIKDKDIILELYLQGYNATEIAKKLNKSVEAIRKCIQRNYSHLKERHKISTIARKETVRAVNYEANKFISDRSFIKKNRSIYRTKENGDIVVNKKVAPVVTWDTPRRLKNENKKVI